MGEDERTARVDEHTEAAQQSSAAVKRSAHGARQPSLAATREAKSRRLSRGRHIRVRGSKRLCSRKKASSTEPVGPLRFLATST